MSLYVPGRAIPLLCVRPLARWGTQLGGRGVGPPRASAGLATGVHIPPPGLRDGAACGEPEKEGEGCFGWGWGRRSPTATPGGGGPENPAAFQAPPTLSSHRRVQLEPESTQRLWFSQAAPPPPPRDSEQDGERISRGSGSFQAWIHFLWTP